MIDTVKLQLASWRVRDGANIEVQGAKLDYATGEVKESELFTSDGGKAIKGSKAFCNNEKFNLSIVPLRIGGIGAFVQFSLPKVMFPENYFPIPDEQIEFMFEQLEGKLAENGIEAKVFESSISRMDLFKNIITNESVSCYSRVFELINAKHIKDRRSYGVAGWLWANSQQEYCIYEKRAELLHQGIVIPGIPETMRFEHRCLNSEKVESAYGGTTIAELKAKGWDALRDARRKAWQGVFRYDVPEIEVMAESQLRNELLYFQAKFGERFLSRYFKVYGARYVVEQAGGFDVLRQALKNIGASRLMIYRAENEIKKSLFELEALKPADVTNVMLGDLYRELKEKVLDDSMPY